MALPVVIPNTFANANASIPLSQLDNNFSTVAVAINGMANGAEALSNVNITGGSIANASLSNVSISSGNVTINVANVTTLDATNVEVTNIKAKDGTASATIADSTGVMTIGSSVLTTADINGGTIDGATIGATTPSTGAFTTLSATGVATFSAGSAAAPAITTSGDTNNGIFFPAADVTAITTSGSERMRINSSGNLLVGTTSVPSAAGVSGSNSFVRSATDATWTLLAQNTAASGGARGIIVNYSGQSPNDTTNEAFFFYDSVATRFGVRSNGGIENYQANDANLSDRREKTNFAPAKSYLDTICAIPVQTFNYIDQNMEDDPGLTLGVVAQDVQAVAPELVMESNWASQDEEPKMRLSIYQTDLQYALMKCIQELKAELDAAKARIAALEAQ